MFVNEELKDHLETSSTIKTQASVIGEWNLNIAGNISKIGNYRYRPLAASDSIYKNIVETYKGTITFISNKEKGTIFKVTFPKVHFFN